MVVGSTSPEVAIYTNSSFVFTFKNHKDTETQSGEAATKWASVVPSSRGTAVQARDYFSKCLIPLLASLRGGVAEQSRKYSAASAFCKAGQVVGPLGKGT